MLESDLYDSGIISISADEYLGEAQKSSQAEKT